jgi:hypothetical protein
MLPGILNRVKAVTDLKSVLLFKNHNIYREGFRRDEYVNCKIDGKIFQLERSINAEYASITNMKYKQCNIYLCRKGKYWERYHNSKKY